MKFDTGAAGGDNSTLPLAAHNVCQTTNGKQGTPMLEITPTMQIPETEFAWSFARSGGPGGQNVNKVESKAVLRWKISESAQLPQDVKIRLALQQKRFFTQDGEIIITSQRFRD